MKNERENIGFEPWSVLVGVQNAKKYGHSIETSSLEKRDQALRLRIRVYLIFRLLRKNSSQLTYVIFVLCFLF